MRSSNTSKEATRTGCTRNGYRTDKTLIIIGSAPGIGQSVVSLFAEKLNPGNIALVLSAQGEADVRGLYTRARVIWTVGLGLGHLFLFVWLASVRG